MRIRLGDLRKLIREAGALDTVAFADEREYLGVEEHDNEIEKRLYKNLGAYLRDNIPLDNSDVELIKKFIVSGEYEDVFKEPTSEYVFRGMAVGEEYIDEITPKFELSPDEGMTDVSYDFNPKYVEKVSSWTLDKSVARTTFGLEQVTKQKPYVLVLVARVSDNPNKFVSGPDGLYDVGGLQQFVDEQEVIGIGDIKVCRIVWERAIKKSNYRELLNKQAKSLNI